MYEFWVGFGLGVVVCYLIKATNNSENNYVKQGRDDYVKQGRDDYDATQQLPKDKVSKSRDVRWV